MTYLVILSAVLAVAFWPQLQEQASKLRGLLADTPPRYLLAAAMLAGCLVSYGIESLRSSPQPLPGPPAPPATFSLAGKFVGPTASQDAATLGALCDELAAVLEHDWEQPEPRIKTGAAIEDLRVAAREARLRGESIGSRQPRARDAVKAFLDEAAGTSGGPLTQEQRSAWVAAFREVGRAASDAAQ